MTLDSLPDLEYKRVVSCKDSFHGTNSLAVCGLSGVGPRVEDPGLGHIAGYPFSAPYEDVKLKAK